MARSACSGLVGSARLGSALSREERLDAGRSVLPLQSAGPARGRGSVGL